MPPGPMCCKPRLVFQSETYGNYRDNLTSGVNNPYSGGFDAGNNQ